ncbi:protein disulfide-isomerase 1 [Culex quinquefasciatus]|nr:protein disulfide-isomerase 1 [Culex quinquefasciatus]
MEFLPYSAVAFAVVVATASAFNLHLAELDAVDDFDGVPVSTKLSAANFEQQLNSTKFYLVLFYAPWCEYCLRWLPQWTDLAAMVRDKFAGSVRVGHLDCIREEAFCSRLSVEEYPTLRVYSRGPPRSVEAVQPYELEDTVDYLQEYVFNPPGDDSDSDAIV